MRFVTQFPGMVAQVRPQRQRSLGDGSIDITQEPIYVHFQPLSDGAFLFENEEAQAAKQFSLRGRTQELDRATPSPLIDRLALVDTDELAQREGWDDQTRRLVEEKLLTMSRESPNDLFVVTTTPILAPFPNFDSYEGDAEQLVARLAEDGFDLAQVLYYETTFGGQRPDVVAALEELIAIEAEQTVSA